MTENLPVLGVSSIDELFEGRTRDRLERDVLTRYLPRQRWFSSKARVLTGTRILDHGRLGRTALPVLTVVIVDYEGGGQERYSVPLTLAIGETADALSRAPSGPAMAWLDIEGRTLLVDGLADDDSCAQLVSAIDDPSSAIIVEHPTARGMVRADRDRVPLFGPSTDVASVRRTGAEQSNSSIVVGSAAILKMYRKLEAGVHPELEIGRYLWTHGFTDAPQVLASLEYLRDGEQVALAVLHALVANAQDGWQHALANVRAFYTRRNISGPAMANTAEAVGTFLNAARILGDQTGQLHRTLAAALDPAMAPEPLTSNELTAVASGARVRADRVFGQLAQARRSAAPPARERIDSLFDRRSNLTKQLDTLVSSPIRADKTRCHQDFHLGQVLWTGHRYALLDFEGEPLRPLAERRTKRSPLTDVAGMLRSYSYAAWSGLFEHAADRGVDPVTLEPQAREWESAVAGVFLAAYHDATTGASFVPGDPSGRERLLRLLMIDKALYELEYELNNRPGWILVPVEGLIRLM